MTPKYEYIGELSKNRKGVFLAKSSTGLVVVKERNVDSIQREYQALKSCQGPMIGELLGLDSNRLITTYYSKSRTLLSLTDDEKILALKVMDELFLAIKWCHKCGFIHGDIKPSNVLIFEDQSIKLIDFGASLPIGTKYSSLNSYEYTIKPTKNNIIGVSKLYDSAVPQVDWEAFDYYRKMIN